MEALGYNLAEATWLVNTRGSAVHPGSAQTKPLHTVGGHKVPVVYIGKWLGKAVWIAPPLQKGKTIHGIVFTQRPGCTWCVM